MNDVFSIEITANVVAWYGAIVATLGFIFSAYNIWRDSAHIKINFNREVKLMNSLSHKNNVYYAEISVVNRGRRPIKIINAVFLLINDNKHKLFLSDSVVGDRNKVLTEAEPKTQFFVEESFLENKKIWCIVVEDETGRKYKKYLNHCPFFTGLLYKIKNKWIKTFTK